MQGRNLWLAPQFTRAIRKTASAMLSAAARLISAYEWPRSSRAPFAKPHLRCFPLLRSWFLHMAGPAVHERHSQNRICDALRCVAAHFCSLDGAPFEYFCSQIFVQAWITGIQFTRAIRKTASAMLSAALQLIFAH